MNRWVQTKAWLWYWIARPFKGKGLSRPMTPWANNDGWLTDEDMVAAIRKDDELGVKKPRLRTQI